MFTCSSQLKENLLDLRDSLRNRTRCSNGSGFNALTGSITGPILSKSVVGIRALCAAIVYREALGVEAPLAERADDCHISMYRILTMFALTRRWSTAIPFGPMQLVMLGFEGQPTILALYRGVQIFNVGLAPTAIEIRRVSPRFFCLPRMACSRNVPSGHLFYRRRPDRPYPRGCVRRGRPYPRGCVRS